MADLEGSQSGQPFLWLTQGEERRSIQYRRSVIFKDTNGPAELWGLALSGGGIRSATFCLGVLQALSMVTQTPINPGDINKSDETNSTNSWPLLASFDYLSTVSGGGYVGGFYSAMFRRREHESGKPDSSDGNRGEGEDEGEALAKAAYQALATDPPGRLGKSTGPEDAVADRPLRWLRENGRYLAPDNSGDMVYGASIAIRNFCAVHFVVGITLLFVFLSLFCLRYASLSLPLSGLNMVARALEMAGQPAQLTQFTLWGSPLLGVLCIWTTISLIPCGVAYWLDQDAPAGSTGQVGNHWAVPRPALAAALFLVVGTLIAVYMYFQIPAATAASPQQVGWRWPLYSLALFCLILFFTLVTFAFAKYTKQSSARIYRTRMTRWFSRSLIVALVLVALALLETAGQSIYVWLHTASASSASLMSVAVVAGTIIFGARQIAPSVAQPSNGGLLLKLPLNAILGAAGLLLALLIAVAWQCLATALIFGFDLPPQGSEQTMVEWAFATAYQGTNHFLPWLSYPWGLMIFCLCGLFSAGFFMGFVNLSSLQTMYAAKLTRAYLGASNPARFSQQQSMSVTESEEKDDFSRANFYASDIPHLGPAHLINVTINATKGSGDQLTQRDRQGLPLAVTPNGITVNGSKLQEESSAAELSIGQWIGISGAAFSTGIGRGTSLGLAMLFCITNIRLGWWWNSGQKDINSPWNVLRNQRYLWREFSADFNGTDGAHWYLSDGGHFENTGVYELLRRRLGFIVCCDCGADPTYEFGDLANLMRLARIDFGAEFELISPAEIGILQPNSQRLAPYFAQRESQFSCANDATFAADNLCALAYRVRYADGGGKQPSESILLVLKPRLIAEAPLDLFEYKTRNASFPQQSTFDQFFDEAQWESYRKLGVLIASRIFSNAGASPSVAG